ncbi:MAG: TIGR02710 family CRISPR-associated CARF protein [Limisphaerales bacterium]
MSHLPTEPQRITAALVSVGGSPAPVLHVLRQHRPAHVWYFCSVGSRANADAIQAQLDWRPATRFIEVARFEELGPCYRELRRKIPEILTETKVPPAEVLVDYTGGTKTMSAALVLAAAESFQQFSYVGGEQREKAGLGIVLDGTERTHYQTNPWSDLAIREVERARDLWAGCQFEVAAHVLLEVAPKVPHRLRFEAIADLASALAARHRLDFRQAKALLDRLQGRLPLLLDGRNDHGLLALARNVQTLCESCASDKASDTFLRELLDNALRTAAQGRYEDAAARLYRAMEMQGQLWLNEATAGLFVNGKCKPENADKLPDALKALPFCQPDETGEIRLSLEQTFRALAALGHERARAIVADLDAKKSRWRAATEKRNTSILAHGVQPIGANGFEEMKQIATDFLGFDLTRETNPIPPLDPRWFEAA